MNNAVRRVGISLLAYAAALAIALPLLLYSFKVPDGVIRIDRAQFVVSDASAPARVADAATHATVTLPHDWRRTAGGFTTGWYRLHFQAQEPAQALWALVIPTVRFNAQVLVNGQDLGSAGRMDDPVTRNVRNALVFSVPAAIVRPGSNVIDIRVRSAPDGIGFLDRIYVGEHRALQDAVARHNSLRVTVPKGITMLLFVTAIMIGALALVRHSEREYLYFCLGTLLWAVHSLSYFVADIPISDRFWDWLRFATTGLFAYIGGIIYVHRYLGIRHAFVEKRILLAVVVIGVGMALLRDASFYAFAYYAWHPLCQSLALYGFARMTLSAWRKRDMELHLIASTGLVMVVYGFHDLLVMWGVLDWSRGYILHYSMLLTLGLFCAVLIKRFVNASNQLEALNHELEARIVSTREQLAATYAHNRELADRRVVAEERDRIMRDMHDGMGGQLITTLALIEQDEADLTGVANSLRAALQDLRLMIDSLDVAGEDIATMLGMFRARVEPSLSAHGIALTWQVEPVGEIPDFGSAKALHVLRILQEAVTNAIKHSGASQITLSAKDRAVAAGARRVTIEVRDNGNGGAGAHATGRGIANMHSRAKSIGATVHFLSNASGTCVSLQIAR